jgi:hypothetical protein
VRVAVVAGLPGTGKSLVIRELVRLAAARGRLVHTVQWDIARPVFEAAPAGRPYPLADGVTHVVIRKAAGLWVREAVAAWDRANAGAPPLLVVEAPLVGGRFIELARPARDAAEDVLDAPSSRFIVPVPSAEVRRFVEAERDRRMARPVHPREREDAPSHVLRALWNDLASAGRALGLPGAPPEGEAAAYDPALYEAVYRHVLSRRRVEALPLARVLPVADASVYDLGAPAREVLPAGDEIERAVRAVEAAYREPARLEEEAARWYVS